MNASGSHVTGRYGNPISGSDEISAEDSTENEPNLLVDTAASRRLPLFFRRLLDSEAGARRKGPARRRDCDRPRGGRGWNRCVDIVRSSNRRRQCGCSVKRHCRGEQVITPDQYVRAGGARFGIDCVRQLVRLVQAALLLP